MDRIWIRGTTGSGKTTLGNDLSRRLDIPAIDLDDLHWLRGWEARSKEQFLALVEEAAAGPCWVMMGNYGIVHEVLEPRAEVVVWLDFSLPVTFGRVLRRTIRRFLRREVCCNGNRESIWNSFFTRKSILWWCLTTHGRRHRDCAAYLGTPCRESQERVRLRNPAETRTWLSQTYRSTSQS